MCEIVLLLLYHLHSDRIAEAECQGLDRCRRIVVWVNGDLSVTSVYTKHERRLDVKSANPLNLST